MLYLDHNATTPLAPEAFEAMRPWLTGEAMGAETPGGRPANAHAQHAYGWAAHEAVEVARQQVAALVGADPAEVVFTSGATEACLMAIRGVAEAYASTGRHLVTVATEHPAVLAPHRALERAGWRVTVLPVDADGRLSPDALAAALTDETVLVSAMAANNETGVLHDVPALAAVCRARGVRFFTDATQAAGKVPVSFADADLLALSAHKCYGPMGVGALVVRRRGPRVALAAVQEGGGQENGRRGGTLNVPGIVGFGAAAALASDRLSRDNTRTTHLRTHLEARLVAETGARVHGAGAPRLPNTTSAAFAGVSAERLLSRLAGRLALATGAACSSARREPSPVLLAMGVAPDIARATVRVSLGRSTTEADVDGAADALVAAVQTERQAGLASRTTL